jgi:hypothetical protein
MNNSSPFEIILQKGKSLANDNNVPTSAQIKEYKSVVVSFIKRKKRIVYGGTAVHYAIAMGSNYKEEIYSNPDEIDYDFYSPDPISDSIELCNELYEKKFPYVKRNVAISGVTYRIQVNTNIEIADITYCPESLFNRLETLKTKDSILFIHPNMLRLDMYKAISHMPHDFYRLTKDYSRLMMLEHYYPMKSFRINEGKAKESTGNKKDHKNLCDKIMREFVLPSQAKKETIVTGDYAYNFYISIIPRTANKVGGAGNKDYSGKISKGAINYLSLICISCEKAANEIMEIIRTDNDNDTIILKKFSPLLKIVGETAEIYYHDQLLCFIQEPKTQVVPYIKISHPTIDNEFLKISDYFGTLSYYHIRNLIEQDDSNITSIVELKIAANKYLQKMGGDDKSYLADPKNPFHIISLDGMQTYANTSVPTVKFSGKNRVLYLPENGIIQPNYEENKEYYKKEIDPYLSRGHAVPANVGIATMSP